MTPRFITGVGVCSTVGIGREAFFAAMRSAVPMRAEKSMAEVPEFDPAKWLGDKGLRTLDRLTKLMIVAARLAALDAGLKKDNRPPQGAGTGGEYKFVRSSAERVGMVCSNAYGSLEAITELNRVAQLEDARYINPAKFPNTVANSASGYVSIWEEFRALNVAISDGNCGALDAFTMADIFLGQDRADAMIVGGAEASSEALYLAFSQLGVLETAARLGEGAAFVVVEKEDHNAMAQICGASSAHGAPDNEQRMIHASGDALARAIKGALADANTTANDVDLVVSGVSGLRVFDRVETSAIRRALRDDVAIAAPKRVLGETLGAGGAMATVSALAYLAGAPPTPIVHGTLRAPLRTLVLTSLGYYGNASAVVMKAPREVPDVLGR